MTARRLNKEENKSVGDSTKIIVKMPQVCGTHTRAWIQLLPMI